MFSHSNEKQDKALLLYCSIGKSADVTQIYALTGRSRQFWVVRKLESVEEPLSAMSAGRYDLVTTSHDVLIWKDLIIDGGRVRSQVLYPAEVRVP